MLSRRLFFGAIGGAVVAPIIGEAKHGERLAEPTFVVLPWDGRAGYIADGRFFPEGDGEPESRDGVVPDGFRVKDGGAQRLWKKA